MQWHWGIKSLRYVRNCWNMDKWDVAKVSLEGKMWWWKAMCQIKEPELYSKTIVSFKYLLTLLSKYHDQCLCSLKDEIEVGNWLKAVRDTQVRNWNKKGLEKREGNWFKKQFYQHIFMREWMWKMRRLFLPVFMI